MPDGLRKAAVEGVYPDSPLNRLLLHQWIRFILVGGVNTAFSYGIFAACIFFRRGICHRVCRIDDCRDLVQLSHDGGLVFRNAAGGSLLRFTACYAVVYAFSVMLLEQMDSLGINPYVSGIGVAIPAALLSFVLLKMLAFRKLGSR